MRKETDVVYIRVECLTGKTEETHEKYQVADFECKNRTRYLPSKKQVCLWRNCNVRS
jgi:hypothetical protein